MRAAAIALVALVAGCKTPEPPGSFGVDLTITLDGASRAGLAQVLINVSGAEEYAATLPASAFPDGTGQLHYIPGAHSGTISIGATAQDGAGAKLGAGNSGPITLTDGKSVAATLAVTMGGSSSGDGGTDDMGSGLKALGAMCGFDNECDSGHCVDGFCCGVATCGQCENCGATGMCAAITNKDDNSAPTCNGPTSCDSAGMCKMRWVSAMQMNTYSFGSTGEAAAVGNLIFFQAVTPAVTFTYDVAANTFATQTGNNYICNCGSSSYMFPAAGQVCEFGNVARCMDSTTAAPRSWNDKTGFVIHQDGAWAAVGNTIYGVAGYVSSVKAKTVSTYDITTGIWGTAPDAPFAIDFGAAGSANGMLFALGSTPASQTVLMVYTPSTTSWQTLSAAPPSGIYREYMPTWNNKLVAKVNSALRMFDLTTMTWEAATIPLPANIVANGARVVVAGTPATIYVVADDAMSQVHIFKYAL